MSDDPVNLLDAAELQKLQSEVEKETGAKPVPVKGKGGSDLTAWCLIIGGAVVCSMGVRRLF